MAYNIIKYDSSNLIILNNIETLNGNFISNGQNVIANVSNYVLSTSNTLATHLNDLNSKIFDSSNLVKIDKLPVAKYDANGSALGVIKVDGVTITVDEAGIIRGNSNIDLTAYATKSELSSVASGLTVLENADLATTANINLSGSIDYTTTTIDGSWPTSGSSILVKNQTNKAQNGIYILTLTSGPTYSTWQRRSDFNTSQNIKKGSYIFVKRGVENKNTGFISSQDITTLNTDPIDFNLFTKTEITAGTGIAINGSTVSIKASANGGIVFNSDSAEINLSASSIQGILPIVKGGTGASSLANLINLDTDTNSILPLAKGGTGASSFANLINLDTDTNSILPLAKGGTGASSFANLINLSTDTNGVLPVAKGGTGASTLVPSLLVVGNGTNIPLQSANLSWNNDTNTLAATNIMGSGANITNINVGSASAGILPIVRGGTGSSTLTADIITQGINNRFIINNKISLANQQDLRVATNILPDENDKYSLGSSNLRWKDIFVSANTITIGEAKLSSSPTGALEMSSVSFTEKLNLITSNELHTLSGITKNVQQQINELNLDGIADGATNRYIKNDQYDGSITVYSNLNVGTYYSTENPDGNLRVFGDLILEGNITTVNPLITQIHRHLSNYNTGFIDIHNIDVSSNKPSIKIKHNTDYSNIFECYSKNDMELNDAVFIISSNGNVGINNNTPTEKLDVIGNIKYTGKINNISAAELDKLSGINYNIKQRIDNNDSQQSNFTLNISNILQTEYKLLDRNVSNFILNVSNILQNSSKETNVSNYILSISNMLTVDYKRLDNNVSNYILNVSNFLSTDYKALDKNVSNYVLVSNANTSKYASNLNVGMSNYLATSITTTSNLISSRISSLTTDNIAQGTQNKYITNNTYSGQLNINSATDNQSLLNITASQNNTPDADIINIKKGTTELFKMISNGFIGVRKGAALPTVPLDVEGDIKFTGKINDITAGELNNLKDINYNIKQRIDINDSRQSNYISDINTSLSQRINTNDSRQSNYISDINTNLSQRINTNDSRQSNYISDINTSISQRITNITTDTITQGTQKKFIIDDIYNGNLIINSNLTVHGSTTTLNTDVYTTERLDITNINQMSTALTVRQMGESKKIISALKDSEPDVEIFSVNTDGSIDVKGNINFGGDLFKGAEKFKASNWNSNVNGIASYSNVAIGKDVDTNSAYKLDVAGNINISGDLYKDGSIFKASNWNSNVNGIASYSNVAIGKDVATNSAYKLDVAGNVGLSGELYKITNNCNYLIETVKSDLYIRDPSTSTTSNLTGEPIITFPVIFTENTVLYTHSGGSENQTTHTFTLGQNIMCDILIVGGGGSGGSYYGGGGGGGGILFATNIILNAGNYIIKVGNGGFGIRTTAQNGNNGHNSSITINSVEYIANGGGGGGTRASSTFGRNGNDGGSGGGGSHTNSPTVQTFGGVSNKNTYTGWLSYGNNGGKGRLNTSSSQPTNSSGGGGGAGSVGSDFSYSTGGGNGGSGLNFSSTFGSSVGHSGWFGGGGGGSTYYNAGNPGYGNGGNGLLGGGGNGGFDGSSPLSAQNGLANTGGGGGGANISYDINGGNGGSGIVIIKFKSVAANPEGNPITHKTLNFTYLSTSPNTYTVNFPVPTTTDIIERTSGRGIMNNSNLILQGAYDINFTASTAQIIPKSGQFLPSNAISNLSQNIGLRYHLRNPIKINEGAQWTYSTSNTNVYHLGNVGIGTKKPEFNLDVLGDIRITGDLYKGAEKAKFSNWNSNVNGISSYSNIAIGKEVAVSSAYKLDVNGAINSTSLNTGIITSTSYIRPSAGSGANGIIFQNDPGGGSGDVAWIKYYPRGGEACSLEIGSMNDADDHIILQPNVGCVGINKVPEQAYKLDVEGSIKFNGNLNKNVNNNNHIIETVRSELYVKGNDSVLSQEPSIIKNILQPPVAARNFADNNVEMLGIIPMQVTGSHYHTTFLTSNFKVFSCGYNEHGELGRGSFGETVSTPTQITANGFDNINIINIASKENHTLFVTSNFKVYSCGNNGYGQLGRDTGGNSSIEPVQITLNGFDSSNIISASCGNHHSLFLTSNFKVYSCGHNGQGQLGHGTIGTDVLTPTELITDGFNQSNIISIAGGAAYSLFLTSNFKVYSCGNNGYGQLGHGTIGTDVLKPTKIILDGFNEYDYNVIKIASGYYHNLFLTSNYKVYSCGYNGKGQLGRDTGSQDSIIPTQITYNGFNNLNIVDISCGNYHSLFLTNNGQVYGCGYNNVGQTGRDTGGVDFYEPTLITANDFNNVKINSIFGAGEFSIFLTSNINDNNTTFAYGCGFNYHYQLGIRNTHIYQYPVPLRFFAKTYKYLDYEVSFTSSSTGLIPYNCFNDSSTASDGKWAINYNANGTFNTTYNNYYNYIVEGYNGDWIILKVPSAIKPALLVIKQSETNINGAPKNFRLYASNDKVNWDLFIDKSNATYSSYRYRQGINTETTYNYFALVVSALIGNETALCINEIYIYGKEASVSGTDYTISTNTDTLTKSLSFAYDIANANNYTITFPVSTIANVNNNYNLVFINSYNIEVGNNSYINPISGQNTPNIPKPNVLYGNMISVNYHLRNPVRDINGAQWTYNAANTSVYHLGNVGIGNTNPIYSLDVVGNMYVSGNIRTSDTITSFGDYSDERLKDREGNIENPLDIVGKLQGFYYKPNKTANDLGIKGNKMNKRELGVSAQDVQKILPELIDIAPADISYDAENNVVSKTGSNYLTVNYEKMIPLLIESIKELNKNINELKKENVELRDLIKSQ